MAKNSTQYLGVSGGCKIFNVLSSLTNDHSVKTTKSGPVCMRKLENREGLADSCLRSSWIPKFSPLPHMPDRTPPPHPTQLSGSEVYCLKKIYTRGSLEWKKPNTVEGGGNPPKPRKFGGYLKYEY